MAAAKATAQAATLEAPPVKAGPSMMMQLVMLLVASLLAAGVGGGAGMMLGGGSGEETPPAIDHSPAAAAGESGGGGGHGGGGHGEAEPVAAQPGHEMVIPLAQITTNLAAPSETWIRLEASIVLDEPPEPELADAIHQDLFAFVRTLKMHQIQGPSGFQHLRWELDERASVRSEGKVKRVLIRTLLLE
jgi:flagellar FliL protein